MNLAAARLLSDGRPRETPGKPDEEIRQRNSPKNPSGKKSENIKETIKQARKITG
jgi:hypothetical protein